MDSEPLFAHRDGAVRAMALGFDRAPVENERLESGSPSFCKLASSLAAPTAAYGVHRKRAPCRRDHFPQGRFVMARYYKVLSTELSPAAVSSPKQQTRRAWMYRIYTIRPGGNHDYRSPRLIECADDREALARAAELKADGEVWERERLVGACWVRPLTTEVASRPSAVLIVAGMLASSGAVVMVLYMLSALTLALRN